jgi:glycine/serine hydroxymethyltransferase
MSDLVQRLRDCKYVWTAEALVVEAADRIEALEAELADVQEWSGAVAFVTTVQNVVDADGPPWGDEFLAWYKPDQWFGEHRACAVFIGEKMKAAKGE